MRAFWLAIRFTARLFGSQRKLWVPFLITAFVEALFIGLLWLAPQPPFSKLLAPPVRYFFGDQVLHYPTHLWFLYYAMKHTHLAASIVVGAFLSGVACAMIRQAHEGTSLSLREALMSKHVRYGTVVVVWLITWGLAKGSLEALGRFAPRTAWVALSGVGLMFLLQTLLVYAIPAAVFEGSKWWRALSQGVRETLRYPLSTLIVVGIPSAVVIGFSFIAPPVRVSQWMEHTVPEIIVACVAVRLLLLTMADAVITVGVAHLWWLHRTSNAAGTANAQTQTLFVPRGANQIEEGHVVA